MIKHIKLKSILILRNRKTFYWFYKKISRLDNFVYNYVKTFVETNSFSYLTTFYKNQSIVWYVKAAVKSLYFSTRLLLGSYTKSPNYNFLNKLLF